MKILRKIAISGLVLSSGLTLGLSGLKQSYSVTVNAEEQEVVLPSSVTNRLYHDARAIKDSPYYVDKALLEWLDDPNNLEAIDFFENRPDSFGNPELRKAKDYYYVISYVFNYISSSYVNVNSRDSWGYAALGYECLRMVLDFVIQTKDDVNAMIDYCNNPSTVVTIEDFYDCVSDIYSKLKDVIGALCADYYKIFVDQNKTIISDAKISLSNAIKGIKEKGYDESKNYYVRFINYIDYFNDITKDAVGPYNVSKSYERLEKVIFDTKIDTIFSKGFIDFTLDDFNDAISEALTTEEQQPIVAPYLEKMKDQLLAYYIGISETFTDLLGNIDYYNCILNNIGPISYKFVDFIESIWNKDYPNVAIMFFDIINDIDSLVGLTFSTDLASDEAKLSYAKYIANLRLGSVIPGYESKEKYSKFNFIMDKINKINLIEYDSLEAATTQINALVEEGYKFINVDLISSNENVPLLDVLGLKEYAGKDQRYSYEVKRMVNHDHAFPLTRYQQEDYGDNLVLAQHVFLDFVLTDITASTDIKTFDNKITTVLGIYNFDLNVDVHIYRYDEENNETIRLTDDPTQDEYFEVVKDNIIVHSKHMGSYLISYINRLIKGDYTEFRETITELNNKVNDLNNQITSLNTIIEQKNASITELEAQITTLQSQIAALQAEINSLKATNETQKASINDLNNILSAATRSLNEKIAEVNSQKETIKQKQTLNIIFIVIACVMTLAAATFATLFFLKRKQIETN